MSNISTDIKIKEDTVGTTHLSTISYKEPQTSEGGKDKILAGNIQDVMEEVQSRVNELASKRMKVENISDTSSDSDVIEEGEEEIDLEKCCVRAYIEHTVGQILLTGLTILERERPENPIKWLAEYLLFNKDQPSELISKPIEEETFEPIKLPEHIKKVIIEDLHDLDIEVVNKLV